MKFNWKSLVFYTVAISSVAVLFKVVTAYGETNLKAPPPITGGYRFSAENLPGCLKSNKLLLQIQQSGIYLNASLLPVDGNVESEKIGAEEKPSLFGKWQNQKLLLSGSLPHVTACNQSVNQTEGGDNLVKIEGTVEGETLKGKISLSSTSEVVDFTAQKETPVKLEKKKEH